MAKILPGTAWTVFLYSATAATAGGPIGLQMDLGPSSQQLLESRLVFEAGHVIMHAGAFAILGWLLAMPHSMANRAWMTDYLVILFYIAIAVGLGQEAIQAFMRQQVHLVNSSLDILSDAAGAWLAFRVYAAGVWRRFVPSV